MESFIVAAVVMIALALIAVLVTLRQKSVISPDGKVRLDIFTGSRGRLSYRLILRGTAVIEDSSMGLVLDGVDLGDEVSIAKPVMITGDCLNEIAGEDTPGQWKYYSATITHVASMTNFLLQMRISNDGAAFRYVIQGKDPKLLSRDRTTWTVPEAGVLVRKNNSPASEDTSLKQRSADIEKGTLFDLPVQIELADGRIAVIDQQGKGSFSSTKLKTTGTSSLKAVLTGKPDQNHPHGPIHSRWYLVYTI